jgi:hypothetical protein
MDAWMIPLDVCLVTSLYSHVAPAPGVVDALPSAMFLTRNADIRGL